MVILQICTTCRDPTNVAIITVYSNITMQELKDEILHKMHLVLNTNDFYLTIFDSKHKTWNEILGSNGDQPIMNNNISSWSTLSIQTYSRTSSSQRSLMTTIPTRSLSLELCKRPMDRRQTILISTDHSTSLADLKKQASTLISNQNTDDLYRWTGNEWIKCDQELNDAQLEQLDFHDADFISFQARNRAIPGVCGLDNLGATCFINSALQCLSNTPPFTRQILDPGNHFDAPLIGAYANLIRSLWSGDHEIETPSNLLINIRESPPRFARYRQHDAHEFMSYFLNGIHDELTNQRTMISDLFHGELRSTVTCLYECQSTEINDEIFTCIPLPVENDINQHSVLFVRSNGEQQSIQVTVDGQSKTIGSLIEAFLVKCELPLSPDEIKAVGIYKNEIYKEYCRSDSLNISSYYQLAFMELPKKSVTEKHVKLYFCKYRSFERFRPPVYLVCPEYQCRYADVIDQINTIRNNIFSFVESSTFQPRNALWWVGYKNSLQKLEPSTRSEDYLALLEYFFLEVDDQLVEKYINRYTLDLTPRKPSLEVLLDDFFREDRLNGDYYCSKCQKMTQAKQKTDLVAPLPPVVIIQLKRFTYDRYSDEKIDTFIDYPLENLDLSKYVITNKRSGRKSNELYNLVAVSNHRGSLISGHYTTCAKNYRNNKWYLFNDDRHEEISDPKEIVNKNAYILIYVKQEEC